MMPWEPVETARRIDQEAFLVEARSLSGYSGSPVFVTPYGFFEDNESMSWDFYMGISVHLLGIDCGHLPERQNMTGNSGMMVVVPAWKLLELLGTEEFAEMRETETRSGARRRKRAPCSTRSRMTNARVRPSFGV
jgi:hypothetical protein